MNAITQIFKAQEAAFENDKALRQVRNPDAYVITQEEFDRNLASFDIDLAKLYEKLNASRHGGDLYALYSMNIRELSSHRRGFISFWKARNEEFGGVELVIPNSPITLTVE